MAPEPIDATRWSRARALFLDLVECEPAVRDAEIARLEHEDPELAEWVSRLVESDVGDDASEAESEAEEQPEEEPEPPRRRFGPYEEVRALATGGMGEVFVARRVDGEFEREVAVKVMRRGFGYGDFVSRFLRERQTLALLDHEYIARLLDGGTTEDGEPYLVMEYVEGVPTDLFCIDLDLPARLQLFLRICAAVQHAHECGVIHRDLKPNNILVRPDGTPRLLDFGIARPRPDDKTPGLTRTGQRMFTPEYASPEQIRGHEVDEAADVYALGVLLYQFLTDARPYTLQDGIHELERAICEIEPKPPSAQRKGTTRRRIVGDLDTITLKCLDKSPRRRYSSVAELADDIERHLAGYPIYARRTSVPARVWRYGRRKPWRVVGLAALLLAIFASVVAWRSNEISEKQRRALAEQQRELVMAIEVRIEAARNLRDQADLAGADRELEAALEALEELPDEHLLRSIVFGQLAVVANHRGASFSEEAFQETLTWADRGEAEFTLAYPDEGAEEEIAADPKAAKARVSLLGSRAYALGRLRRPEESREVTEEMLRFCRATLEPGDELTVDALMELADYYRGRREYRAAIERLQEAVEEVRKSDDPRSENLGAPLNLWALTLVDIEHFDEAVERYKEALEVLTWHFGQRNSIVAQVRINLGEALYRAKRYKEADEELAGAFEAFTDLERPLGIASALAIWGKVAMDQGEIDEAADRVERALALRREVLPPNDSLIARTLCLLGIIHARLGDEPRALELFQGALDPKYGVPTRLDPRSEAEAQLFLGHYACAMGDTGLGMNHYERALELRERYYGPDHEQTQQVRALLDHP